MEMPGGEMFPPGFRGTGASSWVVDGLQIPRHGGIAMDWNRVEGNWKQVKGKVKEKWGKLTDDGLEVINGKQDQLEGRLQQRYGYARDQARREVNDWYDQQKW
jgi:uncharacterized protein YjbJ (UPF0337 family)